jgi:peptidoglycan/xylan/chitin deacetylase (PgdA/CDA1 family)
MGFISMNVRRIRNVLLAGLLAITPWTVWAMACKATVYLTIDTGTMAHAETIARILQEQGVKATFFLANEPTFRGDFALDESWAAYWRARVAEGHAFGTHTWQHGYLRGDQPDGRTLYVHGDKTREMFDEQAFCHELRRVDTRFQQLTGRRLDGLWRAPGGHTTPLSRQWAQRCGYHHVSWAPAGFLGDELPSEKFSNILLLQRALKNLKDGDIMMMHLGIRSRHEPFAPMLAPLLKGLKGRGFCFDLVRP